jgi:hypothetical protein
MGMYIIRDTNIKFFRSAPSFVKTENNGEKMNKAAITKHEIYNKLIGFSEQDLDAIANFIDFMRHKKQLEAKKVIKLEGILKDKDIDLYALKEFKQQTWQHVDQEFSNG